MNQILSTDTKGNIDDRELNTIIKVFAIVIIVFGLILASLGIYWYVKQNRDNNEIIRPELSLTQEGSAVLVNIKYKKGIDRIVYSWNDGIEATVEAGGKQNVQANIDLPIGTNTLNISAVDVDGKLTRFSKKQFTFDESLDTIKPQITLSTGESGTVKVVITDEQGLKSIEYNWEDEDVIKPEIEEGTTNFEVEVAAKEGEKTLIIKAIDTSDNEEKVEQIVKGTKKPEISVKKSGSTLKINAKDEEKISKIEYNLNGETKTIENIDKAEYDYKLDLKTGENYIIVTVYDSDGLKAEYKGKCTVKDN